MILRNDPNSFDLGRNRSAEILGLQRVLGVAAIALFVTSHAVATSDVTDMGRGGQVRDTDAYGLGGPWLVDWSQWGGRRIDQGIADRGALSTSLRSFSIDLAVPTGFRDLFGLPAGVGARDARYYRTQGAIFAVFPTSAYTRINGRDAPLIPAGTVFHIGSPVQDIPGTGASASGPLRSPRPQQESWMRLDHGRIDARVGADSEVGANALDMHADALRSVDRRQQSSNRSAREDRLTGAKVPELERVDTVPVATRPEAMPEFLVDAEYRRERLRALREVGRAERPPHDASSG